MWGGSDIPPPGIFMSRHTYPPLPRRPAWLPVLLMALVAAPCTQAWGSGKKAAGGGASQVSQQQKRVTSSENFLAVPGLIAAIAVNYRFSGLLQVEAGLDIPDSKARARAGQSMPRLRDSMRTAVADYVGNFYEAGTVPDPVQIKRRLQNAVDAVLGPKTATVTLAVVMIQPGRQ